MKLQRALNSWQAGGMADHAKETKNPAAVALGRLGGLKGGKARAEKLSASARKRIAEAAKARWSKKPKKAARNF
jgi:ABC-type phosphate/phosphonate transport system ATPase subunit